MALEWIKEQAEKAIKVVGDAGTAVTHELESVEHKLLGDAKPAEVKSSQASSNGKTSTESTLVIPSISELKTDGNALQTVALKSELKSQGISSIPLPKYDGTVLDAVSNLAAKTAITSGSAFGSLLGYMSNPLSAISAGVTLGSELVKVAENIYQTADRKLTLTVNKVGGAAAAELKEEYNKLFNDSASNSDKPKSSTASSASLTIPNIFEEPKTTETLASRVSSVDDHKALSQDMMHWFFNENEKPQNVAQSDNLFSSKNDKQERTDISATAGHVHIEKTDSTGAVKTIVDKTDGKTMVLHGNESVIVENGKEVVKGDGYKVSWDEQGKRHILLDSGSEVIRDGENVKLVDRSGVDINVSKNRLEVADGGISFIDDMDRLEQLTKEKQAQLKEGEAALIAIKDAGTRTIFFDGTIFDVQNDKARLETKNHEVLQLQLKDNKLFVRQDGKLVPFESQENSFVKAENGKFKVGGLLIDPKSLSVEADMPAPANGGAATNAPQLQYKLDLVNQLQRMIDLRGHNWTTHLGDDNCATVADIQHNKELANNHHDSTVAVITPAVPIDASTVPGAVPPAPAEVIKVDLRTTNLDLNNKIIDEPAKTTIKDTNTVIEQDRTVHLGGEDGPTVNPNGSVRVDKDTYVDADMTVHSKDWTSYAAKESSDSKHDSVTAAGAQSAAANISSKASSVSSLAKSGKVRWTDVATLNSALGDVLSLMGSVPGDSQAYAMLLNSYGLLADAISDATPKAIVTEDAIAKGISSAPAIKALEDGASEEDLRRNRLVA